jgi:hypothetical protein
MFVSISGWLSNEYGLLDMSTNVAIYFYFSMSPIRGNSKFQNIFSPVSGWLSNEYSLLDMSTKVVLANGIVQLSLACLLSTILWLQLNNNFPPGRTSKNVPNLIFT